MTHIQGTNSAQQSMAWLLSAMQSGKPSASTAFDPSGGTPQGAPPAPDAGAAPPPLSRDVMGALMGAQEQANAPSSSSGQPAASGTEDAGAAPEIAAKPKKRHGHRLPQGLDALLQATQPTGTDSTATAGTTQAQLKSNLMQQLLKLQAQLTTSVTPSAMTATV